MARNGTTYTYTATPANGQATALRNALASNLTELSVSSLYTFSSGATERNYFVLTFSGGGEILFAISNAVATVARDSMLHSTFANGDSESNANGVITVLFAPQGGFNAAFAAALDPVNEDFFTHISSTQSKRLPSSGVRLWPWVSGGAQCSIHFIEDDANDRLTICSFLTSNLNSNTCSIASFAADMFDQHIEYGDTYPAGMLSITGESNATKTLRRIRCVHWKDSEPTSAPTSLTEAATNIPANTSYNINAVASTAAPHDEGSLQTVQACFTDGLRWLFANTDLVRRVPTAITSYKTKLGANTDYKWIRIIQGWLTPWDHSASDPA